MSADRKPLAEKGIRMLNDNELDAVTGGYINDAGCTTLSTILMHLPMAPKPFIDVFAYHGL